MATNAEIKALWEAGEVVDRNGFVLSGRTTASSGTMRLAHYRVLNGETMEAVRKDLLAIQPKRTVDKVMAEIKTFLEDVLEIDIDQHLANMNSTTQQCCSLELTILSKLTELYDTARYSRITLTWDVKINEVTESVNYEFDANEKSRLALNNVITTGVVPTYWVDANNGKVEDWTMDRTTELLDAITTRDNSYHDQITTAKAAVRTACENKDLTFLTTYEYPTLKDTVSTTTAE